MALAGLAKNGYVCSFEGDARICNVLKEAIRRNRHIRCNIDVFNNFVAATTDAQSRTVSLDHMVFEVGLRAPDLIKMDVEGAECDALLGGERVIKQFRPMIMVETHEASLDRECEEFLHDFGYDIIAVPLSRLMGEKRPIAFNRWLWARPLSS